ncbi:collagenase 3-like [Mauremys mutica]|uniref:collagenase 3-like n=1 Tax=Mauremys mutica TaxID=74926 RepID=UPI001D138998|nr:collagenase 3-like [Mauremys mutica]XP_044856821.1 collagenase 3-like [Mauremys mutica]XP_044856837.1 collagenase 3-like [Mauremys mutica]
MGRPSSPTIYSGISPRKGKMLMESLNKGQNFKDPELGLETLVRAMGLFLTFPEGFIWTSGLSQRPEPQKTHSWQGSPGVRKGLWYHIQPLRGSQKSLETFSPFDGSCGELGHVYGPGEERGGGIHLDEEEFWTMDYVWKGGIIFVCL